MKKGLRLGCDLLYRLSLGLTGFPDEEGIKTHAAAVIPQAIGLTGFPDEEGIKTFLGFVIRGEPLDRFP